MNSQQRLRSSVLLLTWSLPAFYSFCPGSTLRPPATCFTSTVICAGTYQPYAEKAWERLTQVPSLKPVKIEDQYADQESPPVGPSKATTSIQVRALQSDDGPLRYARYALLATEPASSNSIQVLNLCLFPQHKDLPVWGADFVSLPANKHLLLLDAQPMNECADYADRWQEWYTKHVSDDVFPWGGDLPEPVKPFVSKYALWTRLGGEGNDVDSTLGGDGPLVKAFCEHLDIYLSLLLNEDSSQEPQEQGDYIKYRLENDPARPMLQRLYGAEWTEHVLETYLFPQ